MSVTDRLALLQYAHAYHAREGMALRHRNAVSEAHHHEQAAAQFAARAQAMRLAHPPLRIHHLSLPFRGSQAHA